MRLGIIGYGGMAGWHHENASKIPGIAVVAAYDIDPERVALAVEKGLVGYYTLEEFLKEADIDTVLVATPNDVHCELSVAASRADKHVICEKPVAMSVEELDQMIAAAKANGKLFTVHHNRRWDKDYVTAKAVYESGTLGKVYSIQSRLHGMGGAMHGWRGELKHGGGMLLDWGVHFLDQIYQMLGYDALTDTKCVLKAVKTDEVEDYFHITLGTTLGIQVIVEIGTFVLKESPRWMMLGDQGTMYINDFGNDGEVVKINTIIEDVPVIVNTSAGPTRTFAPRPKEVKLHEELPNLDPQWTDFYKNVEAAIKGEAELIVQPWQVRKVLSLIMASFESDMAGKQVEITL